MKTGNLHTRRVFLKCGTCSQAFCHLLNREFDNANIPYERATDVQAGGLLRTGNQCGMLWGASLAVGTESYKRNGNSGKAIAASITTTQRLMESFTKVTKTVNCSEITGLDLMNKSDLRKLIIKTILGGFVFSRCFNIAAKWAPDAIKTAVDGLSNGHDNSSQNAVSCASEMIKRLGGSEEEAVMVSGFAGGLGLSGNACGALSAFMWMKLLTWLREHPGETPNYKDNTSAMNTLKVFFAATDSEIQCHKITGRHFNSIEEHTEFVNNGGCAKVMDALSAIVISKN